MQKLLENDDLKQFRLAINVSIMLRYVICSLLIDDSFMHDSLYSTTGSSASFLLMYHDDKVLYNYKLFGRQLTDVIRIWRDIRFSCGFILPFDFSLLVSDFLENTFHSSLAIS